MTQIRSPSSTNGQQERPTTAHGNEAPMPIPIAMPTPNRVPFPATEHADERFGQSYWSGDSDSSDTDSDMEQEGEDFIEEPWVHNRSMNQNDVTTSFFAGASNVHISGATTFTNIKGNATIFSRAAMHRPNTGNTERATHTTSTDSDAAPITRPRGPRPSGGGNEGTQDRADAPVNTGKKPSHTQKPPTSVRPSPRTGRDDKGPSKSSKPVHNPTTFSFGNGASDFVIDGGNFTTIGGNGVHVNSGNRPYFERLSMPLPSSIFNSRGDQHRGPISLPSSGLGISTSTSGMQGSTGRTFSSTTNTNTGAGPSAKQPRRRREHRNRSGNTPGLDHNIFAPYGGDEYGNGASGFAMSGSHIVNGHYVVAGTITPLE